eukprot:330852-Chlamydomonas_euryale.AAC.1
MHVHHPPPYKQANLQALAPQPAAALVNPPHISHLPRAQGASSPSLLPLPLPLEHCAVCSAALYKLLFRQLALAAVAHDLLGVGHALRCARHFGLPLAARQHLRVRRARALACFAERGARSAAGRLWQLRLCQLGRLGPEHNGQAQGRRQ